MLGITGEGGRSSRMLDIDWEGKSSLATILPSLISSHAWDVPAFRNESDGPRQAFSNLVTRLDKTSIALEKSAVFEDEISAFFVADSALDKADSTINASKPPFPTQSS